MQLDVYKELIISEINKLDEFEKAVGIGVAEKIVKIAQIEIESCSTNGEVDSVVLGLSLGMLDIKDIIINLHNDRESS